MNPESGLSNQSDIPVLGTIPKGQNPQDIEIETLSRGLLDINFQLEKQVRILKQKLHQAVTRCIEYKDLCERQVSQLKNLQERYEKDQQKLSEKNNAANLVEELIPKVKSAEQTIHDLTQQVKALKDNLDLEKSEAQKKLSAALAETASEKDSRKGIESKFNKERLTLKSKIEELEKRLNQNVSEKKVLEQELCNLVVELKQKKANFEQELAEQQLQVKFLKSEKDNEKSDFEQRLAQCQKEVIKERDFRTHLQNQVHDLNAQLRLMKSENELVKEEFEKRLTHVLTEMSIEREAKTKSEDQVHEFAAQLRSLKSERDLIKEELEKRINQECNLNTLKEDLLKSQKQQSAYEEEIRSLQEMILNYQKQAFANEKLTILKAQDL